MREVHPFTSADPDYSVDYSQRNARHTMYANVSRSYADAVESPLYADTVAPARASVPIHWPSSLPHARFESDQAADALWARKVDTFGATSAENAVRAAQGAEA